MLDTSTLLDMKRASRLSRCVDTVVEFVEVLSVDTGQTPVSKCRAVSGSVGKCREAVSECRARAQVVCAIGEVQFLFSSQTGGSQ